MAFFIRNGSRTLAKFLLHVKNWIKNWRYFDTVNINGSRVTVVNCSIKYVYICVFLQVLKFKFVIIGWPFLMSWMSPDLGLRIYSFSLHISGESCERNVYRFLNVQIVVRLWNLNCWVCRECWRSLYIQHQNSCLEDCLDLKSYKLFWMCATTVKVIRQAVYV